MVTDNEIESKIQFILERIISSITKGMSEEEISETIQIFKEIILPVRLKIIKDEDKVIKDILNEIINLNLKERKRYVLINKYKYLLKPLDERSFEMAKSVYLLPDSRPKLKEEALEIKERLLSIAKEIKTSNPQIYDLFSNTISESLLDCRYVITGELAVSLRLGRFMK